MSRLASLSHAFCALLLAATFASCGRPLDRADLVFLNGGEPETLDPAVMTGQLEGRVAYALFEGLLAFDAAGEPGPGVAEKWDISPDGLIYTFHLRHNALWSNGDPVTSADFLRSWRRTLLPETASGYASQLHFVRNAKPFNEGKLADFSQVGLRAPDAWTFEVTLENPTPFFLDLCAFVTLLPVHIASVEAWESRGESWSKPGRLISNGAFTLAEWRLTERIRLAKNERYWNAANIGLRTVDVLPTPNRYTAFNLYATGAADLIVDKNLTPTSFLDELKRRPDFHSAPFLGTYFLRFNTTRKPFNDPRVRLAFSQVIDKEYLVSHITRAGEPAAFSLTPPGTAGYQPPPGPARDLDRARALLAEAGFPGGANFPTVSFLTTGDVGGIDQDLAVELQAAFLRELGIRIQIQRQEWKVYLNSLDKLDYDFCRSSWVGDYKDPNTFLSCFVTGDGNNRTGWTDARFDELIVAAGREVEQGKRFALFREAEQLLVSKAAPICPLFYYVGIQFYDEARLGGIQANLTDEHPIRTMFWKQPLRR